MSAVDILIINGLDVSSWVSKCEITNEVSYARVIVSQSGHEVARGKKARTVIRFVPRPLTSAQMLAMYNALISNVEFSVRYRDLSRGYADTTKTFRLASNIGIDDSIRGTDGEPYRRLPEITLRAVLAA